MKNTIVQRLGVIVAAAAIITVAACSGGANPTPIYPSTSSGINGNTYQVPAVNGMDSTVAVSGTGTLTVGASASAPSVGPVPQVAQRAQTASPSPSSSPNQALIYYTIKATSAVTIKSLTIKVGFSAQPTTSVYLAYWNGSEWVAGSGSGTYSGGTVTLSLPSTATPLSLSTGQSLYLSVYEGQQVGTPVPPAPVVSPDPITISEGTAQTVTVTSKPGFTITAASQNSSLVAVSPSSQTVGSNGTATFTLTASDTGGTTNVTFTDSINQTTTLAVTTTNTYPSPVPAPSTATLSLGDTVTAAIVTQPNSTVTATSSNTAVATVPASETASSTGNVSFTITGVAAGNATITFTDAFGNTGTLTLTVSGIKNGAFTNGLTSWTPCSYPHQPFAAPVDMTGVPIPSATPSQNPSATPSPVPSASLTPFAVTTSVPNNENPTYVNTPPPAAIGTDVALVGSIDGSTNPYPKADFGICQSVTVPANAPYLTMWVWEGGSEYTFYGGDTEADILDSTATTVKTTLFAEENCFIWPTATGTGNPASSPGATNTSGCWPSQYGGDQNTPPYDDWVNGGYWIPKGPFDLSTYAGTTVTLFIGDWSAYADATAKYSQFMYVGGVQLLSTSTFPTAVPMKSHRVTYIVTLKRR